MNTAYDNAQYQRDRAIAYPSLKEFAEAIFEKEIGGDSTKWNAYKTAYNKVRTDNISADCAKMTYYTSIDINSTVDTTFVDESNLNLNDKHNMHVVKFCIGK